MNEKFHSGSISEKIFHNATRSEYQFPQSCIMGTQMTFAGLSDPTEQEKIIRWVELACKTAYKVESGNHVPTAIPTEGASGASTNTLAALAIMSGMLLLGRRK
jgi:hypothetical protein